MNVTFLFLLGLAQNVLTIISAADTTANEQSLTNPSVDCFGNRRLTKTAFKKMCLNQPPPPPPPIPQPPLVHDNCEVLNILSPWYTNEVGEADLNFRGIIYSADSLQPSGNKDGTFTVGPAIGAQYEAYLTDRPFGLANSISDYIGGMLLLDPVVSVNGITSYDSSISYNIYSWYQYDPVLNNATYMNPPQSPVTGGTGNYLCASGIYNSRVFENLVNDQPLFNIIGTKNELGLFYLNRSIICNTCQPFSPKSSKKSKKNK